MDDEKFKYNPIALIVNKDSIIKNENEIEPRDRAIYNSVSALFQEWQKNAKWWEVNTYHINTWDKYKVTTSTILGERIRKDASDRDCLWLGKTLLDHLLWQHFNEEDKKKKDKKIDEPKFDEEVYRLSYRTLYTEHVQLKKQYISLMKELDTLKIKFYTKEAELILYQEKMESWGEE